MKCVTIFSGQYPLYAGRVGPSVLSSKGKSTASLRVSGSVLTNARYVNAKTWDHLARVVRHSAADSSLDEMIQLHFGPKSAGGRSPPNVRRVVYNRLEDIPWLLKTDGSLLAPTGLRAEAPAFVPAGAQSNTAQPEEEEEPHVVEDGEEEAVEHPVDVKDVAQVINADYALIAPTAPTVREMAAAGTIAEAYQRHRALKRVNRKSSEEMRRRVFTSFSTEATKMDWPHRYYRMLFLGPIPHLYIVVESVKNHLYEARSVARKRFNMVAHLELENMQSSLTQMKLVVLLRAFNISRFLTCEFISRSFKDAMELYKSLGPTSDLHKARDLDKLKKYALNAATLMRSLPAAKTLDWEADMKIALRGIVEVKKVPMKQPRPELNVEDLENC